MRAAWRGTWARPVVEQGARRAGVAARRRAAQASALVSVRARAAAGHVSGATRTSWRALQPPRVHVVAPADEVCGGMCEARSGGADGGSEVASGEEAAAGPLLLVEEAVGVQVAAAAAH